MSTTDGAPAGAVPESAAKPDEGFERRFGGMRRLYGPQAAQNVFDAHVIVVGIGGVGSWTAEAVARSGVGHITLIDMDHVGESNVNRQLHALTDTLGQSKVDAMRERIAQINPWAQVGVVDDFVTPDNWLQCLAQVGVQMGQPLAVVDACDQVLAKTAMADWARRHKALFVTVGAAGGKRLAHKVEVADLSETTHDPLLAQLRYRLRRNHGASRDGKLGVACVFSREPVAPPDASCVIPGEADSSLNCHGYGSAASVTGTFGLCAAGWVLDGLAQGRGQIKKKFS